MAEPTFDVITIGDMCVDLIVYLGQTAIRFGQVEQWVPDYFLEMGGSTCIFACQAAKLGLRAGILGRVGDDAYGHLILRRLQDCGVDTRFVAIDRRLKTGLGLALNREDGDRAILTYGGSLNAIYPQDVSDGFLASARHLHYGSYYLQTNLLAHVPDIFKRARGLGLTISLDTNWDPAEAWDGGLLRALAYTDVLLVNENEALAMTRSASIVEAAGELLKYVRVVAIKRGPQGAYVADRDRAVAVPVAPAERVVDTVGAGDSFDAGFIAGWLRGLPMERCATIGNACGRATLAAPGGLLGQLTRREIAQWEV